MPDDPGTLHIEELLGHAAWVRNLALRLASDEAHADDALQELWRRALEHPPRRGGPVRGWLARVLRNALAEQHRRSTRRRTREHAHAERAAARAPLGGGDPDPAEAVARAESLERVVRAVLSLPEPFRETLLLHYQEGLTAVAIARDAGLPAATVRHRLQRGRELLRGRLEQEFGKDWRLACLALAGLPAGAAAGASFLAAAGALPLLVPKLAVAAGVLTLAGVAGWMAWQADPFAVPEFEVEGHARRDSGPAAPPRVDDDEERIEVTEPPPASTPPVLAPAPAELVFLSGSHGGSTTGTEWTLQGAAGYEDVAVPESGRVEVAAGIWRITPKQTGWSVASETVGIGAGESRVIWVTRLRDLSVRVFGERMGPYGKRSGRGLAQADVWWVPATEDAPSRRLPGREPNAQTDSFGRAQLTAIAEGSGTLIVRGPRDHGIVHLPFVRLPDGGIEVELDRMRGDGYLVSFSDLSTNEPVEDVEILTGVDGIVVARTERSSSEWLPAWSRGTGLVARAPAHHPIRFSSFSLEEDHDLQLARRARLEVVVRAPGGEPVNEAWVGLDSELAYGGEGDPVLPTGVFTDLKGHARLELPLSSAGTLRAIAPDGSTGRGVFSLWSPDDRLTITLGEVAPLSIDVVDAAGAAVADAIVRFGLGRGGQVPVDAAGKAHVPVTADVRRLVVEASGYVPVTIDRQHGVADAERGWLTIVLDEAHQLLVTVRDPSGDAHPAAEVQAVYADRIAGARWGSGGIRETGHPAWHRKTEMRRTALSDGGGFALLPDLPAGLYGVSSHLAPQHDVGDASLDAQPGLMVRVPEDGEAELEFGSLREVRLLPVDDLDESPIAEFRVLPVRNGLAVERLLAAAGEDGHWHGWVPEPLEELELRAPNYAPTRVTLPRGGEPVVAEVRLPRRAMPFVSLRGAPAERVQGARFTLQVWSGPPFEKGSELLEQKAVRIADPAHVELPVSSERGSWLRLDTFRYGHREYGFEPERIRLRPGVGEVLQVIEVGGADGRE